MDQKNQPLEKNLMNKVPRPITDLREFELALQNSPITNSDREIIDYIRFIGVFNQPLLTKDLGLETKPPVLSRICDICRKVGLFMPEHFSRVRRWSETVNPDGVRWDGNLICNYAFNSDGVVLTPEARTAQFHYFVVHQELFQGLD